MTITATYNGDLSRVQLSLVDLTDGTWHVERGYGGRLWETVRGGAALPVVAGGATLDDYEFVPDTDNVYRITPIDPPAGLLLTGASYASTPDDDALDITGDLDLRCQFRAPAFPPVGMPRLIAKYGAGNDECSYQLRINPDGRLNLSWSPTGSPSGAPGRTSTVPLPIGPGDTIGVRATLDVDNGDGNHVVRFFYSRDWDIWTQLGSPMVESGATSVYASTTPVSIGARTHPDADYFIGTIMRAQIRDGIGGQVVADPDFASQTAGTQTFTDSAGRTWDVGAASIVGVGESVTIAPSLSGEVWLKSIKYPFLNRTMKVLDFSDIARDSRSGVFDIKGRSVPIAVHDVRSSQSFTLEVATRDFDDPAYDALTEDRDLDLILSASDTVLIHTAPGDEVPGGYVTIGDVTARRVAPGRGMTRIYTLPCRVVAAPAPDVVGTTMTWATVERLYGSWQQLLASNPAWADLVAQVGSPDDLVAL